MTLKAFTGGGAEAGKGPAGRAGRRRQVRDSGKAGVGHSPTLGYASFTYSNNIPTKFSNTLSRLTS